MNKFEEREYWPRVIRDILKRSGLNMQQLADYLGVDPRNVRHWLAGQRRPTGIVSVRLYEYRLILHYGTIVPCEATGACILS